MFLGTKVGAALLGAALVVSPGAGVRADAPAMNGTLPSGGTYLVRPLAGAPVAAIALWYRANASGFDAAPAPGLGRLAATAVAASQPVTGTPLGTFINRLGGRMEISAYPQSVSVSLLVPADQAAAAIKALTRSFFAPVLTDAGLQAARRTVAEEAAIRSLGLDSTIEDSLYSTLFAAGPDKQPPFPSPPALDGVTLAQVRAYAERAFRPANAVLVLSGAVSPDLTTDALTGREDAPATAESAVPNLVASPAPVTVQGTDAGFGMAWAGPPIADEAAATAFDFIADYLFGDGGALQTAAAAAGTSLDGTFVTYHDPGVFLVTATGGNVAATRRALLAAIVAIQKPLPPDEFERARREFTYRLLSRAQTADLVADNYGWYTVEGGSAYTPGENGTDGRYLKAVAALTPASVAAAATRYLGRPGALVTMTTGLPEPVTSAPAAVPAASPSPSPRGGKAQ